MRRRTAITAAILALASGSAVGAGPATPAGPGTSAAPAAPAEPNQAIWQARFQAARDDVVRAREEYDTALAAYDNMRHRRRIRGEAKKLIIEELARAEAAVPEAEAALEKLYREARRAGVPPGWMRMANRPQRSR